MKVTILHNPRCSKSRQTLAMLENRGLDITVIEYLKAPLARAELAGLVEKLGVDAREVIRTGEAEYRELGLDDPAIDGDAILDAVAAHPILLQRPIVIADQGAVIGRPPEKVLELLHLGHE